MPVSVYLTYNTNNSAAESFKTGLKCGYGWKLNIEQYVIETGNTDYPYRYTDADGTEHYFKYRAANSDYIDEDGLGLTLVKTTGAGYTITDQQDTVYTFLTNGNLASIKDSNNNQITLTYSGGLIQYVTDGAGRNITISNTSGILTQIKDPANRATNFTISSNKLTSVTNPDGKSSSFTYNGDNSIATIINPDGYKLAFTYLSQGTRVDTVTEYGNGTTGQKMSFNYTDYNTTKITTSGVNNVFENGSVDDIITTYQFDDLGRLTSTHAKAGEKQPIV